MPVFISYSHSDKDFVDKFAVNLMKANIHVWVDRWEINVGDSLLNNIQEAIQDASALLVVLSKSSVESEWCKKELNAGLIRELEERRVIVLPILLEDCLIPVFLKDKMYADFRTNFDEGLQAVTQAVAKVTSSVQNRIDTSKYFTDWAQDWGYKDDLLNLRLTLVEQALGKPFSVLIVINILANKQSTKRYNMYKECGLEHMGRFLITEILSDTISKEDLQIVLTDQFPAILNRTILDSKTSMKYDVEIESRRLGQDTGFDLFVDIKSQILELTQQIRKTIRPLTKDETLLMVKIINTPIDG